MLYCTAHVAGELIELNDDTVAVAAEHFLINQGYSNVLF